MCDAQTFHKLSRRTSLTYSTLQQRAMYKRGWSQVGTQTPMGSHVTKNEIWKLSLYNTYISKTYPSQSCVLSAGAMAGQNVIPYPSTAWPSFSCIRWISIGSVQRGWPSFNCELIGSLTAQSVHTVDTGIRL